MYQKSEIRFVNESLCIASIHIAKSREKATAQTKTCQRVWLPQR